MSVYVVDCGPREERCFDREIYVIADDECEAVEAVSAMGYRINYAEHYSDDDSDIEGKEQA